MRQHEADDEYQHELGQALDLVVEIAQGLHHVRAGELRVGCHGEMLLGVLQAGRAIVTRCVCTPPFLHALQREAGGKSREKAGGGRQLRDAVSQCHQTQREKFLMADGAGVAGAQVDHQPAEEHADGGADRQAADQRPCHVECQPVPAAISQVAQAHQAESEHDERVGGAIIEPAFAGEAEAQAVAVGRVVELDVCRQHRVGRRQDAAEQDRYADWQGQKPVADGGDQADRHQHGNRGQPHRQPPLSAPRVEAKLHADRKQRNEQRDFGDAFE